jgi:hypothetical protein
MSKFFARNVTGARPIIFKVPEKKVDTVNKSFGGIL